MSAALDSRATTALDEVRTALHACAEAGRELNAVVAPPHVPQEQARLLADRARAAADDSDARRADGRGRSRLDGVPFAIKDVIDLAGVTTTMGSTVHPEDPAAESAEVVRRFESLGLIPVAKTTCHEHSYGILGEESAHGRGVNPLRPGLTTGGSSYGSAIAVAAGIVPVAIGTDTAGSVRVPAACAGVTGFKPTLDRVPTTGVAPLSTTLDTVGFFTRTPADMRLLWDGFAPDALGEAAGPASRPGSPLVLGLLTSPEADTGAEWMARRVEPALAGLHGVSPTAIDPAPFAFDRMPGIFARIRGYETYRVHRSALDAGRRDFQPQVLRNLENDAYITEAEHAAAFTELAALREAALGALVGVDALVLPTIGTEPVPWDRADQGVRNRFRLYTQLINLLGWPAISVPVDLLGGRGAPAVRDGEFPASVQLVMAPGRDSALLDLAVRLTAAGPRSAG